MADFQYQPDMTDPVAKLRSAMDTMDGEHHCFGVRQYTDGEGNLVEGILKYHIPPETEEYIIAEADPNAMDIDPQLLDEGGGEGTSLSTKTMSNLRLFPPPLFSRQGVPQNYKCAVQVLMRNHLTDAPLQLQGQYCFRRDHRRRRGYWRGEEEANKPYALEGVWSYRRFLQREERECADRIACSVSHLVINCRCQANLLRRWRSSAAKQTRRS